MKRCHLFLLLTSFSFFGCGSSDSTVVTWTMLGVNHSLQQTDAHLVQGYGKTIMIDTGHKLTASKLIRDLNERKIKSIDAIFITHPHSDHYGGLLTIIESEIEIGVIYMNDVSQKWMKREWWGGNYGDLIEIRKSAEAKNILIQDYSHFDTFSFSENCHFRKLFIFNEDELSKLGIGPDINELSLVAELTYGPYKALFTGDLNKKLSNWIVRNSKESIICDVLKVPHHGTEGLASNEFFLATRAKACLVPSPRHLWDSNRSLRTRMVFSEMKSKAIVNGEHGNVEVEFSSSGIKIRSDADSDLFSLIKDD
jgi:competence protein ComEC